MERLSIFDIYKIGVGPSSSHTMGPWKAARHFTDLLKGIEFDAVECHLYGSLSKTGIGHGTDIAIQMGLEGYDFKTIDTAQIGFYIQKILAEEHILINGKEISFSAKQQIIFHDFANPKHPNTISFHAFLNDQTILEETYFSMGGGFIEREGDVLTSSSRMEIPCPITTGKDLLEYAEETDLSIAEIVAINELSFRKRLDVENGIDEIFNTMIECVYKGCHIDGVLPGGLNVKRRAQQMSQRLLNGALFDTSTDWLNAIKNGPKDFNTVNHWVSCFALAVNEENAALGRIVTSPTNGAAGVIPAVLLYYYCFCENKGPAAIRRFFYTSGEIGCLFKKRATISAAVGGCQAEIGVSSAMAAGGLTELLGGTPGQVLMAAEIAMEHHLGMTCDPIGGLVQIPCIERNTMGAMKAITASNLALSGNPHDAIVTFDLVVKAMWETAKDMNGKYKETSEAGLAVNVQVKFPSC